MEISPNFLNEETWRKDLILKAHPQSFSCSLGLSKCENMYFLLNLKIKENFVFFLNDGTYKY